MFSIITVLHSPSMLANFGDCSIYPTFIGFEETSSMGQFSFSLLFTGHQHSPSMFANFGDCSIIYPTLLGSEETSSIGQFSFFSAFHWAPSISKPLMTLVSFVKTTKSYFSLVTISRQTSYDSSILRLRNHTRFANES